MTTSVLAKRSLGSDTIHYDAIIIGAGFGGIYMLKKLRDELGLKVRAFDKAAGVGGRGTGIVTQARSRIASHLSTVSRGIASCAKSGISLLATLPSRRFSPT